MKNNNTSTKQTNAAIAAKQSKTRARSLAMSAGNSRDNAYQISPEALAVLLRNNR